MILAAALASCAGSGSKTSTSNEGEVRTLVDTVGFAHLGWQVDSVLNRIDRTFPQELAKAKSNTEKAWRAAICPHDDYTYASWHYPAMLRNINAKTVVILGVAHKARQLHIADRLVFDSYPYWHGPYKNIKVSSFREPLMKALPKTLYQVSDSLQKVEHSIESMLPILQHFNPEVEILPVLVPFMNADKMSEIAGPFAAVLAKIMKEQKLAWGKDVALLITTDAVHYGDEDWGGKNMAPFGADSTGYLKAVAKEQAIIDSCLTGEPAMDKIRKFIGITVRPDDYKEYQWTWCGRYSLPLGLMVAIQLQQELQEAPLKGKFIGYTTSIDHPSLPVKDLRMGQTAKANIRHWVGYASVGYE